MITTLASSRSALRKWAADKPIEIQGAVRNVCGTLRILEKSPGDEVAQRQLAKNVAALELLKRTHVADERANTGA